jgi:hypothetical protein
LCVRRLISCRWISYRVVGADVRTRCPPRASANKKRDVDYIASGVNTAGIWAESIHGDKDQWERQKSLDNFAQVRVFSRPEVLCVCRDSVRLISERAFMARHRQGRAKCIVATDVAARGLDIPHVSHVINYDFPMPSKMGQCVAAHIRSSCLFAYHPGVVATVAGSLFYQATLIRRLKW